MSTVSTLNSKLAEFSEWVNNLSQLTNETVKQYRGEIKLKSRKIIKFKSEVDVLKNNELIVKFSELMTKLKDLKDISNGKIPSSKLKNISNDNEEKKLQSPDAKKSNNNLHKLCLLGKDCTNNNPKHYYDYIHFEHSKSDKMIQKYEKILKKQKCNQIYNKHIQNKTNNQDTVNVDEFSKFLTDEELALQMQAMMDIQPSNNNNKRQKRTRNPVKIVYKDDDEDKEDSSSEEEDDDDEDFDITSVKRNYRKKIKNNKKLQEEQRRKELEMDEFELEKLRKERLNKLLQKTEKYMAAITRKVRKNYKQINNDNNNNNNKTKSQLTTSEVRNFLTGDNSDKAIEQTKSLIGGTLKDYQQVGLKWMVSLNQMRLNGILADEMGLGKTVQILGLLAYILDNDNISGKHLIVAPLSTLSSWRDHFADWLPSLNVYIHRGDKDERKAKLIDINNNNPDNINVIISTYQMVIRDADTLSNLKWCYLIVDEAHTLKNSASKLFESLNAFSTKYRLLLTGTPLQNNLNELWSLLNFILPSIFDSAQSFDSWFCTPFQHLKKSTKDNINNAVPMSDSERLMVMDRLHRAIDPFLLRRMKKDVLPELVKKKEFVIKLAISGMQSAIYSQLQKYGALKYLDQDKRYTFNNILMQLRKCSNHPYLFIDNEYDITDEIYKCSGKFMFLKHLIPKMNKFNHRMLIFCQFVSTMDILSEFFDFINEKYLRIDGSTDSDDRIKYLAEFNDTSIQNNVSIFLLSTRACGLGLNLYTADTVILFDSDWNPQQDLQAMARCHRIGQTKEVRVFRLISDNTIEECIYDRAQNKLDLERKAIECGKFDFSISGKERKEFLQKILKQRTNIGGNKYKSDIKRSELNKLLSRNDNEWKIFNKMDKNEIKNDGLIVDKLLPNWLNEIKTDKDAKEILPKKRKRNQKSYNENEYWKNIDLVCKKNNDNNDNSDKENKNNDQEYKPGNNKNKKRQNRKRKRKDINNSNIENDDNQSQKRKKRKIQQ